MIKEYKKALSYIRLLLDKRGVTAERGGFSEEIMLKICIGGIRRQALKDKKELDKLLKRTKIKDKKGVTYDTFPWNGEEGEEKRIPAYGPLGTSLQAKYLVAYDWLITNPPQSIEDIKSLNLVRRPEILRELKSVISMFLDVVQKHDLLFKSFKSKYHWKIDSYLPTATTGVGLAPIFVQSLTTARNNNKKKRHNIDYRKLYYDSKGSPDYKDAMKLIQHSKNGTLE